MYLQYFSLKEEPFNMTPDPRFLFFSNQHEAAIESLLYGIRQRKGFLTLTGEIGTGKTTLCRELINRLDPQTQIAAILNPLLSVPGLLKAINQDFDNPVEGEAAETQLDGLNHFLLSGVEKGRNAVVLIDEAQNLSVEALEMTRLLSNLETDKQKLLQIILVGQPELEKKLKNPHLRQRAQRINIRYHLRQLNMEETREYIFHRLLVAGGEGQLHFEEKAIKGIFRYSEGYPRLINILCDRSLLAAYAAKTRIIHLPIVKEALRDVNGYFQPSWWRRLCRLY